MPHAVVLDATAADFHTLLITPQNDVSYHKQVQATTERNAQYQMGITTAVS
jgi:hypothetical protein